MRSNERGGSLAGATNLALMAPVREGILAPGFEPISYLERLHRLLDAMHASRRNARESEMLRSVFPDAIGRFGIISGFRYALMPPSEAGVQRWHLSLNVTFDGGWEPYMRVIYRDIGPLLDALLCHCEGYPGSRTSDYDTYCRWVRSAEFAAGIFYTDPSGATLSDQNYLASVERIQRDHTDPATADKLIAAHAEPADVGCFCARRRSSGWRSDAASASAPARAQGAVSTDRLLGGLGWRHPAALCATGPRGSARGDEGSALRRQSTGATDPEAVRRRIRVARAVAPRRTGNLPSLDSGSTAGRLARRHRTARQPWCAGAASRDRSERRGQASRRARAALRDADGRSTARSACTWR